jgi:hypothetical protein
MSLNPASAEVRYRSMVKQSFVNLQPPGMLAVLECLNWGGRDLLTMRIMGESLIVAYSFDASEHEERLSSGRPPAVDPLLLRCVAAEDPTFLTRPAPVHIEGAVAVRRTWTAARSALGVFAAFGARAAVLPEGQARSTRVIAEAAVTGVGLVVAAGGEAKLVQPAEAPFPTQRTWVHRAIEESVYDAALAERAKLAGYLHDQSALG